MENQAKLRSCENVTPVDKASKQPSIKKHITFLAGVLHGPQFLLFTATWLYFMYLLDLRFRPFTARLRTS